MSKNRKPRKCVHCQKTKSLIQLSNGDSYCEKHYEEDGIYLAAHLKQKAKKKNTMSKNTTSNDLKNLAKPSNDRAGITEFLEQLERSGWLYHLDDDPREIKHWQHQGGRDAVTPTDQEVEIIADQAKACLAFDTAFTWSEFSRILKCEND